MKKLLSYPFAALLLIGSMRAELQLPPVFSDHMVLQQACPVKVFGKATPERTVEAWFADYRVTVEADREGHFELIFPPQEASWVGQILTLRCDAEQVVISDVLVGEVWLASGQSNMEKPMGLRSGQRPTDNFETEVSLANHPGIRLLHVPWNGKIKHPGYDLAWLPCTSENLLDSEFSAVAYYFSRELLARLDVPVGIIDCSFGGTMIETWIPREYLAESEQFACKLQQHYFAWVEGVQASEQYEAMVRPMQGFSVKGFLWYQGESNLLAGEIDDYAAKMELMIAAWRDLWTQPEAPFVFVQLAPFQYSSLKDRDIVYGPDDLPLFWEQQVQALSIPYTSMICITDLAEDGRDIHPTNKRDVGIRLGHLVLQQSYGATLSESRNPAICDVEYSEQGSVNVQLEFCGEGLYSADGQGIHGFTLAGEDHWFYPAIATVISANTISLRSEFVSHPIAVRFGWHETQTSNLRNASGLPVVPFRSDRWKNESVNIGE